MNIYASDINVEEFVERLTSGHFIDDVFVAGRMVEDLPAYVSGKLGELIEANGLYWRNFQDIDPTEKERRQRETLEFLREDFLALCDKKTKPKSLLSFAASTCGNPPFLAVAKSGAKRQVPVSASG